MNLADIDWNDIEVTVLLCYAAAYVYITQNTQQLGLTSQFVGWLGVGSVIAAVLLNRLNSLGSSVKARRLKEAADAASTGTVNGIAAAGGLPAHMLAPREIEVSEGPRIPDPPDAIK